MARIKKTIDKESLRLRRAALYEAIAGGELTLQNAVKEMRGIARLTQAEFAAHRGVSTKVIKEIESGSGNPTVGTLNRIGHFFGLEVAFVRSEKLHDQAASSAAKQDNVQETMMLGPVEDARRMMLTLEELKRLASPSQELQDSLKTLESSLTAIQNAQRLADPLAEPQRVTTLPADVLRNEMHAVEQARQLIDAAEKIQRQIQPPEELSRWLSDLDKVGKILNPLHSHSPRMKK